MFRTLISFLVVVVLLVVGVGFYRGWFSLLNQTSDSDGNKMKVNLTVDGDKIQEDADAVKKKTSEFLGKGSDSATKPDPSPGR